MISLTDIELVMLLDDFGRLDSGEQLAILDSLRGYLDSGRDIWAIECSPATAIYMDLVTYILESHDSGD